MTLSPFARRLGKELAFVVLSVLLCDFVRAFLLDVKRVAGASMEPTLRGGEEAVLVDRLMFLLRAPRRFEPVVYDGAAGGEERVKRVVAFGGECVRIRGGDVEVGTDPLALAPAPRPSAVEDATLIPIYRSGEDFSRAFLITGPAPRQEGTRLGIDGSLSPVVARFRGFPPSPDHSIRDVGSTAKGSPGEGDEVVSDIRIELAVASIDPGAELLLAHALDEQVLTFHVTAGGDDLSVKAGVDGKKLELRVPRGSPLRLDSIDGRVSIGPSAPPLSLKPGPAVEGIRTRPESPRKSTLTLNVSNGSVVLAKLDIWRDIHYSRAPEAKVAAVLPRVPEGAFFVLGDNSRESLDSRVSGAISSARLVGRPIAVCWPLFRLRRVQ